MAAQLSAPEYNRIHAEITNHGGDVDLSGTAILALDEDITVDFYLERRFRASEPWIRALELLATREGAGWRLRHTVPLGHWF